MKKKRSTNHHHHSDTTYLFKYLLLANFLQYLEAGAVPALLLPLALSFQMTPGQQGLLGGVVYLSLGFGSPFAGYLLRHYNHKVIISIAVTANMLIAFLWALTPVGYSFSISLFIFLRFLMGLCQCIICVYLPLWANENAPKDSRTVWMSYLQASVPLGVMVGYVIAAISISLSLRSENCAGLLCWRWPILIEVFLLSPLYLGLYFVPSEHISLQLEKLCDTTGRTSVTSQSQNPSSTKDNGSNSESSFTTPNHFIIQDPDVQQSTPVLGQSTKQRPAAPLGSTPPKSKSAAKKESEKKQLSDYRRHSINASIYDPLSIRDVIKRSSDNLVVLDSADNVFDSLSLFHWSHKHSKHKMFPHHSSHSLLPEGKEKGFVSIRTPLPHVAKDFDAASRHTDGKIHEKKADLRNDSKDKVKLSRFSTKPGGEITEYESLKDLRRKSRQSEGGYFHFHLLSSPFNQGRRRSSSTSAVESFLHQQNDPTVESEQGSVENRPLRRNSEDFFPRQELNPDAGNPSLSSSTSTIFNLAAWTAAFPNSNLPEKQLHASETEDLFEHRSLLPTSTSSLKNSPTKHRYSTFTPSPARLVSASIHLPNDHQEKHFSPVIFLGVDNANDDEKTIIEDHLSYQGGFDSSIQDSPRSDYLGDEIESDTESECDSDWENFPTVTPDKKYMKVSTDELAEADMELQSTWLDHFSQSNCLNRSSLWFQSVQALLRVHVYRNLLGAMTALYFTVTGVQYWGTKYLTVSLNAPIAIVNLLFVLCAATGPTTGVLFGGWLIDSWGGYKGYKQRVIALEIVTILGVSAFVFSLPITFLSDIYHVVFCLWLVLFFGAAALPACSGILVSIVPRAHRTTSSSLSLVVFNMFGYFLSLILSGYLMEALDYYDDYCNLVCSMTWGFRLVLFWSFFAVYFLVLALFASYRRFDAKSKKYSTQHHQPQQQLQQHQKRLDDPSNLKILENGFKENKGNINRGVSSAPSRGFHSYLEIV